MAEGTYEYECNRAELLGIDPPKRADFEAALKVRQEEMEKELANEVETTEEQLNNTSGKFDELNSILSVTQQRLNKFKTACGSLTNLLKIRGNQKTDMPDSLHPTNDESESTNSGDQSSHTDAPLDSSETMQPHSSKGNANSMQQKMSCQFDKLDAMINKAENAQYSMSHQNKQMKSFLNDNKALRPVGREGNVWEMYCQSTTFTQLSYRIRSVSPSWQNYLNKISR